MPKTHVGFHDAKKKNDEYYTTLGEVKWIFNEIIDTTQLEGKTLYCSCDGEKSHFVEYINEMKDTWKLKEFIYTSDDFNTHEDLFKRADFVITNPPFSLIYSHLLPLLKKCDCKFFLIGSIGMIYNYVKTFNNIECKYIRRLPPKEFSHFETAFIYDSTGENKTHVDLTLYMSNMIFRDSEIVNKELYDPKFLKKSINDINQVWFDDDIGGHYLMIDYMRDVPYDYDGYMLCPISCLFSKYNQLEYDLYYPFRDKQINNMSSDGRPRYVRIKCKKK